MATKLSPIETPKYTTSWPAGVEILYERWSITQDVDHVYEFIIRVGDVDVGLLGRLRVIDPKSESGSDKVAGEVCDLSIGIVTFAPVGGFEVLAKAQRLPPEHYARALEAAVQIFGALNNRFAYVTRVYLASNEPAATKVYEVHRK